MPLATKAIFAHDLNSLGRILELASLLEVEIESADENEIDEIDAPQIDQLSNALAKFTTYFSIGPYGAAATPPWDPLGHPRRIP